MEDSYSRYILTSRRFTIRIKESMQFEISIQKILETEANMAIYCMVFHSSAIKYQIRLFILLQMFSSLEKTILFQ